MEPVIRAAVGHNGMSPCPEVTNAYFTLWRHAVVDQHPGVEANPIGRGHFEIVMRNAKDARSRAGDSVTPSGNRIRPHTMK